MQKEQVTEKTVMISAILALIITASANSQSAEMLRYYDSREFLNSSQKKLVSEIFPEVTNTLPSKSNPWAEVDPIKLRTAAENREARRLAFIYALDPNNIDSGQEMDSTRNAFRLLLERRFPRGSILVGSKITKISTEYTSSYEWYVGDIKTIQRNLLKLAAELGAQWAMCGGQNLYLYNGSILMASFERGRVMLFPTNIDMPVLNH